MAECPALFVPVDVRETGMKGAFHGTREEAYSGAGGEPAAACASSLVPFPAPLVPVSIITTGTKKIGADHCDTCPCQRGGQRGRHTEEFLEAFFLIERHGVCVHESNFLETKTGDLLAYGGGAVAEWGSLVGKDEIRSSVLDDELAAKMGPLYYEDGFTGTGEVLAMHGLTDFLLRVGVNLVVQRSRLLSAGDLRNHDVLFLGSPIGNAVLDQITLPKRFVFELPHSSPYLWQGSIVDTRDGSSSPRFYTVNRDPHTHVILSDYALFDVFPVRHPITG
jgi:hypothetical protein